MEEFFTRLRERKLVQWALAYVAAAFALVQVIDIVAQRFGWPDAAERFIIIALAIGFFVVLVLAWYHGERGEQKASGTELLILALLLAIGGGALWHFAPMPRTALTTRTTPAANAATPVGAEIAAAIPATTIPAKSIAVLPFENLSADKDNAYFADGMQDLILTKLAGIADLKVIARTSTVKYTSHPDDLKTIAQQLGVATILEGSVQKAGNQVLINVQLIDANTDSHVWAESYTRTLDNIFGVEGEVAQKVADALNAKLTTAEIARVISIPTTNTAAYAAYLRGRAWSKRAGNNREATMEIIAAYEQAVRLDPKLVQAWAGLAKQHVWMYWEGYDSRKSQMEMAKTTLERAEKLAPGSPEVALARGWYLYYGQHDYREALNAFLAASRVIPNSMEAWLGAAFIESRLGQWNAAVADFTRAHELSPNDLENTYGLADSLAAVRRFDVAERQVDSGLALKPDDASLLDLKAICVWNTRNGFTAMAAALPAASISAAALGNRARLALYQRQYADAAELFREAIDSAGNMTSQYSFMDYLPAAIDYRLALALTEQRSGDRNSANTEYERVRGLARSTLSGSSANSNGVAAWHAVLGLADAGLGLRAEAIAEGRRAVDIVPESSDATDGPQLQGYLAQIYALNGDVDDALPLIAHLLDTPYTPAVTVAMLRLDPTWDPIRHDPRFQALLTKYVHTAPASSSGPMVERGVDP